MSRRWIQELHAISEVEIVGFVDLDRTIAEKRRDEVQLPQVPVFTSLDEALAESHPDVVTDCTVPGAHHTVTMAALKAGCHVLGEKPLSDSMENAREMVEAAQAAGKTYAVMQNRRHHTPIRNVRRILREGAIGKVHTIHCDFFIGAHFGGFRDEMRNVLLLDMAIHTFDQARFLSETDPRSVYCHEWNPPSSWYQHDASAVAIFEMTDEQVFCYRGSWCSEGLNTKWESSWRIIGSEGSLLWDGADSIRVQRVNGDEGFFRPLEDVSVEMEKTPGFDDGHGSLIRDFFRSLREGQTPDTVASDNIHSLAMVFGAIESASTHQRHRFDD